MASRGRSRRFAATEPEAQLRAISIAATTISTATKTNSKSIRGSSTRGRARGRARGRLGATEAEVRLNQKEEEKGEEKEPGGQEGQEGTSRSLESDQLQISQISQISIEEKQGKQLARVEVLGVDLSLGEREKGKDTKKEEVVEPDSRKRKRTYVSYVERGEEDEVIAQEPKKQGRRKPSVLPVGEKVESVKRVTKKKKRKEEEEEVISSSEVITVREVEEVAKEAVSKPRARKNAAAGKKKKIQDEEEEVIEENGGGQLSDVDEGDNEPEADPKSQKKPRKPRKKKDSRPMIPFAARAREVKWLVGAHVSMSGGVQNAVTNALQIGGNAFALFLKSQRKWSSPALKEPDIAAFHDSVKILGYNTRRHIVPHGSYLVNLAQHDEEKYKQAYDCFLDDLKRCERLGIGLYNFHPGNALTNPRPSSLLKVATSLNNAHAETSTVITLLENMAGHGHPPLLGSTLEDLAEIISHVKDKSRVGVCIDTCHAFASGYDLRTKSTFDTFWQQFDTIVGRKYLKAMHINDSKAPFGSRKDLHQFIGQGYLGLEAFRLVMNSERLQGIPLILETPMEREGMSWAEEIKLLESLVGVSGEEEWFLEKSMELQELGREERERVGEVVERRREKDRKAEERRVMKEEKEREKLEKEAEGVTTVKRVRKVKDKTTEKKVVEKVVEVKKRAARKKAAPMVEEEESESHSDGSSESSDDSEEEGEGEGCKH